MKGRTLLAAMSLMACACGRTVFVEEPGDAGHEVDDDAAVRAPPDASIVDAGAPGDAGSSSDATEDAAEFDAAGIPQLANCLASPYEFQVIAADYAGLNGTFGVDGSQGTWSGMAEGDAVLQLDVAVDEGWAIDVYSDYADGQFLEAGTYTSGAPGAMYPLVQVEVDGMGCDGIPNGTITLVDFATTGGDQASLTRFVGWFDLACNDAGSMTGCVRYGE